MTSLPSPGARPVSIGAGYVPVIDLAYASSAGPTDRAHLARALDEVCRTSGFFVVEGHRVPRATIDEMLRATTEFFALPQDAKVALLADQADPLMRGFSWPGRPRPPADGTTTPLVAPDLSESYVINRYGDPGAAARLAGDVDPRLLLPNKLPDLAGFAAAYHAYYAQMERLAMDLMRLFAEALGMPAGWFDDKFDDHMTSLSANFYPSQHTRPGPGQLRKSAHSDWGTLTLLYQDENAGGLQVWNKSGEWVDVPPVPGTFVVNIGDLMAYWTNDVWSSTVHRVVNPPLAEAARERYSVAFFHQPDHDALIECIPTCLGPDGAARHPPVRSYEYLSAKARRAFIKQRTVMSRTHPGGDGESRSGLDWQ